MNCQYLLRRMFVIACLLGAVFQPASHVYAQDVTPPSGSLHSPLSDRVSTGMPPVYEERGSTEYASNYPLVFNADDGDGSGVEFMYTQIVRFETGEYWNGSVWQDRPSWRPLELFDDEGTMRWRTLMPVDFTEPGRYVVRMHIRDAAGNHSASGNNPRHELVMIPDEIEPYATTNYPEAYYTILPEIDGGGVRAPGAITPVGFHTVSGVALEVGLGISRLRVQVERRGLLAAYWNGLAWQSEPIWVTPDTEVDLQYGTVFGQVLNWQVPRVDMNIPSEYAVRIAGYDLAGNRSSVTDNWRSYLRVE